MTDNENKWTQHPQPLCPICGSASVFQVTDIIDEELYELDLMRCNQCDHEASSESPEWFKRKMRLIREE